MGVVSGVSRGQEEEVVGLTARLAEVTADTQKAKKLSSQVIGKGSEPT